MSLTSPDSLPWASTMRRLDPPPHSALERQLYDADAEQACEWMAPERVLTEVTRQYLEAWAWLEAGAVHGGLARWRDAAHRFLTETCLQQFVDAQQAPGLAARTMLDIMRCEHQLSVRYFSRAGDACYVHDVQRDRRAALYDLAEGRRVTTQDLGSGAVVCRVCWDRQDSRWKLAEFVQHLPAPEALQRGRLRVVERSPLPSRQPRSR